MEPRNSMSTTAAPAQRVIPLLQSLNRLEELAGAIAMRLDPITQHAGLAQDKVNPPATTVTGRINNVGDTLQYLLDNIEL